MKLKFRAWDENSEEMIYEIGITPEGIPYSIPDNAEASDQFNYYSSCHKMQFTGLHDKKGNEIYIGDIVSIEGETTEGFYRNDLYEVTINSIAQIPVIDSERGQMELFKCYRGCEVVGNIYQNPELLEEKSKDELTVKGSFLPMDEFAKYTGR